MAFPDWLDPATLEWAAEYCEAMTVRILGCHQIHTAYLGADVCGKGLRSAHDTIRRRRAPPPRLTLASTTEGSAD